MIMIERVARAIHASMDKDFPKFTQQTWEQLTGLAQQAMLIRAVAAISAMREPTESMVEAALSARPYFIENEISHLYPVMIDAALAEAKQPEPA